jgi:hypothetical protein
MFFLLISQTLKLINFLIKGDEVVGISASSRDKDDILQIWNYDSTLETKATVCQKLEELVPNVNFTVKFYKRKLFFLFVTSRLLF